MNLMVTRSHSLATMAISEVQARLRQQKSKPDNRNHDCFTTGKQRRPQDDCNTLSRRRKEQEHFEVSFGAPVLRNPPGLFLLDVVGGGG